VALADLIDSPQKRKEKEKMQSHRNLGACRKSLLRCKKAKNLYKKE
jgi:hypothetical protein